MPEIIKGYQGSLDQFNLDLVPVNKENKEKLEKKTNKSNKPSFAEIYNSKKYKYIVTQGNNSKLIREAMKKRFWWVEIPNFNTMFNFKWQPTSHRMKFSELGKGGTVKQMVNHLEFHKYLSDKSELFSCLQQYCEQIKTNVFRMTPITFFIDVDLSKPNAIRNSTQEFLAIFNMLETSKKHVRKIESVKLNEGELKLSKKEYNAKMVKSKSNKNKNEKGTKFKTFNFQKRPNAHFTQYEMPLSHFCGHNFWILKATNLNRGRGIHVFKDIKSLHKLIEEYCKGVDKCIIFVYNLFSKFNV